jgi:hypothetical protein
MFSLGVSMPNYFVAAFAFGWPTDRPGSRKHFDRSPLFEIARVLVRFNHVARFIETRITASCDRL